MASVQIYFLNDIDTSSLHRYRLSGQHIAQMGADNVHIFIWTAVEFTKRFLQKFNICVRFLFINLNSVK